MSIVPIEETIDGKLYVESPPDDSRCFLCLGSFRSDEEVFKLSATHVNAVYAHKRCFSEIWSDYAIEWFVKTLASLKERRSSHSLELVTTPYCLSFSKKPKEPKVKDGSVKKKIVRFNVNVEWSDGHEEFISIKDLPKEFQSNLKDLLSFFQKEA